MNRATSLLALVAMVVAVAVTSPLPATAQTGWCPAGPLNPNTTDIYPGNGWYPSGPVSSYPWETPDGTGVENFDSWLHGELIDEPPFADQPWEYLVATSGTFHAEHVGAYRGMVTADYNPRMVFRRYYDHPLAGHLPVKWTNGTIEARFQVTALQPTTFDSQGLHLFARYRSGADNYVASLRTDGTTILQVEKCHIYNGGPGNPPLAQGVHAWTVGQWVTLKFSAVGSTLTFYIDGVQEFQVTNNTFSWGTFGIRADYVDLRVDYVKIY